MHFSFNSAIDDVGATNFEAVCKSGARLSHSGIANNGRGEWGPVAYCPKVAPAVCGIKTRIDGLIGKIRTLKVPSGGCLKHFCHLLQTMVKVEVEIRCSNQSCWWIKFETQVETQQD